MADADEPLRKHELEVRYRRLAEAPAPRNAAAGPPLRGQAGLPSPFQCPVFMDAAQYGVEVLYPYETECRISWKGAEPVVSGNFGAPPAESIPWPPVRWVNPEHYSLLTCVDLVPDAGHLLRIGPHPRYFNDRSGTVPAAVVGNLDSVHWPMFLFLTFKSPLEGQEHVLRFGDPLAQIVCVPNGVRYRLVEMSPMEQSMREQHAQDLMQARHKLATRSWVSELGHRFDNLYRLVKRSTQ